MKNLILSLFLLFAVSLSGQTFTGTWQGTLKVTQSPNSELRIVVKISTTDKGALTADLYNIDQPGPPLKADGVTQSGTALKMSFASLGGTYDGRLEPDGQSITGTWTLGSRYPLTLVKATTGTAWSIPEPPPPPRVMPADADPGIEVATIKPSRAEERLSLVTDQSLVKSTGTSVADLIKFAYNLHRRQIVGGPSWVESERFDVTIKSDTPGEPSIGQTGLLLRKLLADRFALAVHRDRKELSAYVITVAKDGPKIPKEINDKTAVPDYYGSPQSGFRARNSTIAEFANMMTALFMDQPVVDQTGLGEQRYAFVLKWTPDPSQHPAGANPDPNAPPPATEPDAPDVFAAFQQQLGLRIQSAKAQVDVLVIDKVERPSAN